jgi:hypothetical protein
MRDALDDPTIRAALRAHLAAADPPPFVREETMVTYGAIADVLAIHTATLHGYEIKSDRDRLDRLRHQAPLYSLVLDRCTLVTGERHHAKAAARVPAWWGVLVATVDGDRVSVAEDRPAADNPTPWTARGHLVGHLLWGPELRVLVEHHHCARGVRGKGVGAVVKRLRAHLGDAAFAREVCAALKARPLGFDAYRAVARQARAAIGTARVLAAGGLIPTEGREAMTAMTATTTTTTTATPTATDTR